MSSLPTICIALFWAAFSFVSALGLAYHMVIRKAHKQNMLEQGGRLSGINNGRTFRLILAFIISSVCMAGLILEAPKWTWVEWLLVLAAIPLYLLVSIVMRKLLTKEYKPLFCASKVALRSCLLVALLLIAGYALILAIEPATTYASATEAFVLAEQPLADSSSVLLSEAGKYMALADGLTSFGLSKTSEISFAGYLALRIVLCAAAFFSIANLVSVCSLRLDELKRIFMPLETYEEKRADASPKKCYVVLASMLPVLLIGGFLVANHAAEKVVVTEEYTRVENSIRDLVGVAVYIIDGRYYEQQAVEELLTDAAEESQTLSEEAQRTLTPLINDICDKQIANVDSYLDWYYSLPADYDRLIQTFTGTIEDGMKAQLSEMINAGIDDSELVRQLQSYVEQAAAIESGLREELAKHELIDVPEWLIVTSEELSPEYLSSLLEPAERLASFEQRLATSAVAGAVTGVVVTQVTKKILAKPVFSKLITRLTTALAARGLTAAAGTLVAPGVGTAVGIATGFGVDFLLLKIDEGLYREVNKTEIIAAIEEGRAEMLAMLQDPEGE